MKKSLKITSTISVVILSIIACVLGYFFGNSIVTKYFSLNIYEGLDREALLDDVTTIKYEGKTPDQLSAAEVYQIAHFLIKQEQYFMKESSGTMSTSIGVEQTALTSHIKDGDSHEHKFITYSSALKQAGKFNYTTGSDININKGSATDCTFDNVNWTDQYTTYGWDEYCEAIGRTPDDQTCFIVSSKTVTNDSFVSAENGTYTFKVVLDPVLACSTYAKEVSFQTGSDLSAIHFYSAEITFIVDENYRILAEFTKEKYDFKYTGISVTISADFKITYKYNK